MSAAAQHANTSSSPARTPAMWFPSCAPHTRRTGSVKIASVDEQRSRDSEPELYGSVQNPARYGGRARARSRDHAMFSRGVVSSGTAEHAASHVDAARLFGSQECRVSIHCYKHKDSLVDAHGVGLWPSYTHNHGRASLQCENVARRGRERWCG